MKNNEKEFEIGDIVQVIGRADGDELEVGDICEVVDKHNPYLCKRLSDGMTEFMSYDEIELISDNAVVVKSVPAYTVSVPGVDEFSITAEQAHQLRATLDAMLD